MTKATKRILSLYMLFTLCFMAIFIRIVYINFSSYATAAQKQSSRTIVIGTTRGKIYDRNLEALVDNTSKLVAAVTPVQLSKKHFTDSFHDVNISEKIEKGYPFVTTVKREINNELIRTFSVPVRYSAASPASHLVGYTDSSGRGVTGVEAAFEKELASYSGRLSVTFEVDALGRVLAGMDKTVSDENFNSRGGVVLTVDSKAQKIVEAALEKSNIKSGCAILMKAESGEILALASMPDFDRNNVEKSIAEDEGALVNKALCSYSAGSVFKSIIAAFALENGEGDFHHNCKGSVTVGEKSFSCFNGKAHGETDLSSALENSCNTYFIKLIERLDTDKLIEFCRKLGFGESISLCEGIVSEQGILPDSISLGIPAGRANFSFGQGDLLITPLQLIKAYGALATGKITEPWLVYGFCDNKGQLSKERVKKGEEFLSEETVLKMRSYLCSSVEKGVAATASSEKTKIAGKTGTAQSGIFNKEGEEVLRTWMAGFYPSDSPQYIVVVMNEDGVTGSEDCAPVLREICENWQG